MSKKRMRSLERGTRSSAKAAVLVLLLTASARAQQRPEAGYVYPPGGRAGTTVEVRLGGYDFTPDTQFFVLDERVELQVLGPPGEMLHPGPPHWFGPRAINSNKPFSIPREVPARLTIPADMPAGVVRWQAANANGASSTGEFVVNRGPPEVLEEECPKGSPFHPTNIGPPVAPRELPLLPLTLSGRLEKKEEVDYYRFRAQKTGPITCAVAARRFGAPLHAVVEIFDASGRPIADAADPRGQGLHLTFAALAGQTYALALYDLDYRGDRSMVYRLTLRQAPRVVAAVPAAGRRGETRSVTFFGHGVATGQARLESTVREVMFPSDPAIKTLAYRLKTPFGVAAPFELGLSDIDEAVEPTGNGPRRIDAPGAVTGALDERFAEDSYRFRAEKGQLWRIDVQARQIGSPLDVALTIFGADGKAVAKSDDLPETTDAGLLFRVPADGDYRIAIRDVSGRAGSPASIYRLAVSAPRPGFELLAPERVETTLGAAKPGALTIQVVRRGGFKGPISLRLSGLPAGIILPEETVIPAKKSEVAIALPCAADAASFAALATVRATAARKDGSLIEDEARVLVAPVMRPRAVVRPLYPDAGRTVNRGATYPAPVVVERLEGYEGEVELQMAARPDRVSQGIYGADVTVPTGAGQTVFPLFLPEWVQTDRTSRIVLNTVVQVPDGQGNLRHLVNRMDKRITMNVEGAFLKVAAVGREFSMSGGAVEIPVKLLRSPKLSEPVKLLLADGPAGDLFRAEPVTLAPASPDAAVLKVAAARDDVPPGEHVLTLEARTLRDGYPVISRTEVFVRIE